MLEFLQAAKEPLGIKEIAAVLQKPEPAVRMLLSRMVQDGLLRRAERGRYTVAALSPTPELHQLQSYMSYMSYKVTTQNVTQYNAGGVTSGSLVPQDFEGKCNNVTHVTVDTQPAMPPSPSPENTDPTAAGGQKEKTEFEESRAENFLRNLLKDGPQPIFVVREEARRAGISIEELLVAKEKLGVKVDIIRREWAL